MNYHNLAHELEAYANRIEHGKATVTDQALMPIALRKAAVALREKPSDFVPEFIRIRKEVQLNERGSKLRSEVK